MSAHVAESVRFHVKYGWFNVKERFSDLASGLVGFLLFPFFIWLVAMLWNRFNAYQGNYTYHEALLYIGVTELYFMTFLSSQSISRSTADFSLSLARPRSWPVMSFSGLFGRCLGSRLVYLGIFLVMMPMLGVSFDATLQTASRIVIFIPILGLCQALVCLLFASGQVLWMETGYFILPVSKLFLALGGVFGPLVDYGEPWRSTLLALPPSDLFFQPAHFCVKGEFYRMSGAEWITRVVIICAALGAINFFFYRYARKNHQSYGG